MATVTTLAGGATAGRTAGSVPYLVSVEIDFAAAATAKGLPWLLLTSSKQSTSPQTPSH
jgi:hypothetical protein